MPKLKIVGLEKALQNVPEADRAALAKDIREMFESGEAAVLEKTVLVLPVGTKTCPKCGDRLVAAHSMQLPEGVGGSEVSGKLVQVLDCNRCEQPYMMEAKN